MLDDAWYEVPYLNATISIKRYERNWYYYTSASGSYKGPFDTEFIAVRLAIAEVNDSLQEHYGSIEEYHIRHYSFEWNNAEPASDEIRKNDKIAGDDDPDIPF